MKKFKVILVLGTVALVVGGFAVNSIARGYHNSVAGDRAEKRLRAKAEFWRAKAVAFKAKARFWEGRAKASKQEVKKLRAFQGLTGFLGALTMFVLALALFIFVVEAGVGVARIGWGFGKGGQEKMQAQAEVIRARARAPIQATPDSAVSKWLRRQGYKVIEKEATNA